MCSNRSWSNDSLFLITPWCRVLLEKLPGSQLVKKLPAFYGTRRIITSARRLSLSWATSIQSTPPHNSPSWYILILSSHLRLCPPSGSFPQISQPKPCIRLSYPPYVLHAKPISFFLITRTILGEYISLHSLRSFSTPCYLVPIGPNILLNTLSLRSSLNVRDQVSYPNKKNKPNHSSAYLNL